MLAWICGSRWAAFRFWRQESRREALFEFSSHIDIRQTMTGGSALGDFCSFDPVALSWTDLSSIPNGPRARYDLSMTPANNLIYVFGGKN
jgi:hypothetical protein